MQERNGKITITKAERGEMERCLVVLKMFDAISPIPCNECIGQLYAVISYFEDTWRDDKDPARGATNCVAYFSKDGTWDRSHKVDPDYVPEAKKTPVKAKKK